MTEKIGIKKDKMFDYQKYAIELRDAFVHKGYQVCGMSGENNFTLSDVKGRNTTFKKPQEFEFFNQLFEQLENDFNQQIYDHAITLIPNNPDTFKREEYQSQLDAIKHMPDWAKNMALSVSDEQMQSYCNQVHESYDSQLRKIFLYEKL